MRSKSSRRDRRFKRSPRGVHEGYAFTKLPTRSRIKDILKTIVVDCVSAKRRLNIYQCLHDNYETGGTRYKKKSSDRWLFHL